jgi:hypothetical protein
MDRLPALLRSPAAVVALLAALAWSPMTGFPTWAAPSRGRYASTLGISLAICGFIFASVQRLMARLVS